MSAQRVAMRNIKECLRLKFEGGLSHEKIARALQLSKGVVSKYVTAASETGLGWPALAALDEVALAAALLPAAKVRQARGERVLPDLITIHRELRRKGVTLQLLWEEYIAAHPEQPTYRYTQFVEHYRRYASTLKRSMRQQHRAGEKLFIDYAGPTLPVIDPATGEISRAHIFVAALGASNYTYACATPGETQVDWLTALGQAFSYLGGVSEMVVPDNPRALIAHPDRYEPGLNRAALECARHYDTVMLPARPRKPQDKAKAEVAVQIVERWIMARLRHQQFFSLHALNQAIAELLEDLNQRPFKKLDGCRREWFERLDQPVLRPLPLHPYEVVTFKRCKVNIDYHIEVNGGFYSVPSALARQSVDVRLSAHTVEVLHGNRRVASHLRLQRRGAYSTQSEHMPASHKAHREWTPQRLLDWGERIGPHARQIVEYQLTHKPHPEMGYRACLGLLSLARQYGNARLEAAASRAVQLRALNGRTVRNLLKQGLDQQPLPKPATPAAQPSSHENVRGADYYTQEELFDDDPTYPEPVAPTAAGRHGPRAGRAVDAAGQP
ncbi:IS21 family transposase [Stutzerimonas stutzeri]|uniref:IS21 family transposase n=1 Tax=Stutzerimonas stutzeri TaxID=316 RepID=UPI00210C5460|nr:IS21 family transposase [Stutzerimonas stutzeri]MCQ4323198.1 IS21 family transposase [Stutzerimonas stutzeri]